jgi:hypothetical protein
MTLGDPPEGDVNRQSQYACVMSPTDPGSDTSMIAPLSRSYVEARQAFLKAAAHVEARVES